MTVHTEISEQVNWPMAFRDVLIGFFVLSGFVVTLYILFTPPANRHHLLGGPPQCQIVK